MNVFKTTLDSDESIKISEKNYQNSTAMAKRFVNTEKKKTRYFAICPECNNPIQIINLFVDRELDENKNKKPMHGKHQQHDIPGLADYSQEAYDSCPLRRKTKFGSKERHTSKKRANEIVEFVKKYPEIIHESIRIITGINVSKDKFRKMVDGFMKAEGYYYRYVSKHNLPFSFLNIQEQTPLYYDYLNKKSFLYKKLLKAFEGSLYFQIEDNQIKRIDNDGFVELYIFLADHKKDLNTHQETISIVYEERKEMERHEIMRETLVIGEHFSNRINSLIWYRELASKIEVEV